MRKKIFLLFLVCLILISSCLVSISATESDDKLSVLPLSVRWRYDPYTDIEGWVTMPFFPSTLNSDRSTPFVFTIVDYLFEFETFYGENYALCKFSPDGEPLNNQPVYFSAPYGFGSPDSFYNISFTDLSSWQDLVFVHYSYYITSDDDSTASAGQFVEDTVFLGDLVDGECYPFRSILTFYGGADTVFISQFELSMYTNGYTLWNPEIAVYNYYEDIEFHDHLFEKLEKVLAYDEDYHTTYMNGYYTGYDVGYEIGYVEGFSDGSAGGFTFTNWLGSALSGFFNNFTFGGFNLGVIFFLIIAILLVLAVIKMFSK